MKLGVEREREREIQWERRKRGESGEGVLSPYN